MKGYFQVINVKKSRKELKKESIQFYTGHCTGAAQFDTMKAIMGTQLQNIKTGMTIEI